MYILESNSDSSILSDIMIDKAVITVGRDSSNDVVIDELSISSFHAKIYYDDNTIYIEDLNSTNGTFINNFRLEPNNEYEVEENQVVTFSKISYTLKNKDLSNQNNKSEDIFTIGRDIHSDLYIGVDTVSRHHLLIRREGENWYIIDNNSTNGTYLNSYDNPIDKIKLERDQILFLGSYRLNTNEIYKLVENKVENRSKIIQKDKEILIGRDPNADIYIDNVNVSWHHAKIEKRNGKYYITDLNSTNGTYVNDEPIKSKEINFGDKITLGLYSFIFQQEQKKVSFLNVNQKGFTINVNNVYFKVNVGTEKEKTLLDNINLTIYPGELVGIMGLSGAGKTTLLKTMSGYTKPSEGEVFVNGLDLYKNFDRIKNSIGYVPQDDIMHPELTVYEALYYSLKLRIKDKLTIDEINKKIDKTLQDLGLPISDSKNGNHPTKGGIKGIKVGDAENKFISGGQRKRVNIAMELLADPEILFLDEPTSGLSSVDAKIVMEKLKELSESGKTIILTIHQPSLINYKKMDNIAILTKGKLAYFGHNYPESIKFFNPNSDKDTLNDPDMALIGLDKGEKNGIDWQKEYINSEVYNKFVKQRKSKNYSNEINSKDNTPSIFTQFKTLMSRYFSIKIKDKINTAILLMQAPIIALLVGFLFSIDPGKQFHNEHPTVLLFILVLSSMWFGIINSVKEIVSEKAIYERERQNGLKLIPYVFSKFTVLSLVSLIQVLILIGIVYLFVDLKMNFISLFSIIYITSLSGIAIGLLTSTIAKSVSQALSLVPIILLPMIIFSGGMIPINKLPVTKFGLDAYRVSFLMPTRWSLEDVIRIYDKGEDNSSIPLREPIIDNNGTCVYKNEEVMNLVAKNGGFQTETQDEITCEDRRCVESLYNLKIEDDDRNIKCITRANPTYIIYIVLLGFIIIPIGLVLFILNRRFKK